MPLPERIARRIYGLPYHEEDIGKSGASVLIFDDMVLKAEPETQETKDHAAMLAWLEGRLPAPRLIELECSDGMQYMLMTRIKGDMLTAPDIIRDPENIARLMAEGIELLAGVDTAGCPSDQSLERRLRDAEYNIRNGLVDMEDAEPDTFGSGGFASPEELLSWLRTHRPKRRPAFSHGDYCLPNIFTAGGRISGFVDLSKSGVSDIYNDIAIGCRSFCRNYDGTFGTVPGVEYDEERFRDMYFGTLGIDRDDDAVRYFILLDELF